MLVISIIALFYHMKIRFNLLCINLDIIPYCGGDLSTITMVFTLSCLSGSFLPCPQFPRPIYHGVDVGYARMQGLRPSGNCTPTTRSHFLIVL